MSTEPEPQVSAEPPSQSEDVSPAAAAPVDATPPAPESAEAAPVATAEPGGPAPDAAPAAAEEAPAARSHAEEAPPAPADAAAAAWAAVEAGGWVSAEAAVAEGPAGEPPIAVEADEEPARAALRAPKDSARLGAEARARALPRLAAELPRGAADRAEAVAGLLDKGVSPVFLGRFRREVTGGLDEGRLFELRRAWRRLRADEHRRAELREHLASCGALSPEIASRLEAAEDVAEMEDVAAPWLPVTATRATVARGRGLQALADAIRAATDGTPALSDLAAPHVKEGSEVPTLDAALGGARDVLAEESTLDPVLRGKLRHLFAREAVLSVSLRPDRRGDAGRHGGLVGLTAPASRVPPLKWLAVRRGERERVLQTTVEPSEERAIALVHASVAAAHGDAHPHGGFLRAAAEDGYRRILRPRLAAEARGHWKARADGAAIETFVRTLSHLLLGPVGGARPTLGLLPDATGGHRVAAVDARGAAVHFGRLPHEPTAGREAAVAALKTLLEAHAVEAVALGSGPGRREAAGLLDEALRDAARPVVVAEVPDGGTRALEAAAVSKPVRTEMGIEIAPEAVGAFSLARRFQDPLAEYVRLDPRSLGLGPNLHDVHQGRLADALDEVVASCVGHVGVDASTADADLLAHVPGLDRGRAKAFVAWRDAGGRLLGKGGLAAVDGVGPAAAEQAVGFLRVPGTKDPRDRALLHPEQYGLVDEIAAQVGCPVAALFVDGRLRARADLGRLARPDAPLPTWKYVLWQLATGLADPRPPFAVPTRPPPGVTLETLRPGLLLEGRVTRAVPFGVFVDVGLGAEALVPLPHIGDRPGADPATVAPVGAVVHGRVLEVDVPRRRIALSLRSGPFDRGDRRDARDVRDGPRRGGAPRPGGPGGDPRPRRDGVPARAPDGAPHAPHAPQGGPPRGRGPERGAGRPDGRPAPTGPRRVVAAPSRSSSAPRVGGGMGGGGRRRDDRGHDRDDPGAPRRISLPMDAPPAPEPAPAEGELSEAALMAKKIEEMKRRLARPE